MIGHARKSHRAKEDRVVPPDLRDPVRRHHLPVFPVPLAAPGEMLPFEPDPVLRRGGIEHADAFGHHFLADAVAGDDRYPVLRHFSAPFRAQACGWLTTARVPAETPYFSRAPTSAITWRPVRAPFSSPA